MAVTVAEFKDAFPEFRQTDEALVQAKLNSAARRIHGPVWGDMENDGIGYLAAHLLTVAPEGEKSRLKRENQVTTYQLEWERMKQEVTIGFRVT